MTQQAIVSLLTRMYQWFNDIVDPKHHFNRSQLEQFFSPDFKMIMNDQVITYDYDSLYAHFNKFRASGYLLTVQLPLEEIIIAYPGSVKQKCVTKYDILKTAADGQQQAIKVMAIWDIDNHKRFTRMNEIVYFSQEAH